MTGIILAAGTSRRLNTITRTTPKTLINVGGKEILGRLLENLQHSGINKVVIVVGYQKDQIIHYCQSEYRNMNITFVDNTKWFETNNAYSLNMALEKLKLEQDSIVVLNGDVVCYKDLIKELVNSPVENAMAVVRKKELNEEDMKVTVSDGIVMNVSKEIPLETGYGEFTGIMKLSKEYSNILKDKIEKVLPTNPNAWFEHGLLDLVREKTVNLCDVSHYPYIEIDCFEDLEIAISIFPYKDPAWEQGGLHEDLLQKGKRNLEDAVKLMADFKEVCDSFGVRTWLNWGTLLGCVREGTPLPWDTDIDMCIDKSNEEILWTKIVPEMKKRRCFVPDKELHCDNDCFIIRDYERVECNTVEKIGNKYIYSPNRCNLFCPAHHIDKLDKITVMGYEFNIPSNVDAYLTGWYGKWRIPSNTKPKSF